MITITKYQIYNYKFITVRFFFLFTCAGHQITTIIINLCLIIINDDSNPLNESTPSSSSSGFFCYSWLFSNYGSYFQIYKCSVNLIERECVAYIK